MTAITEEEAKTKWCPFSRVGVGQEGIGINRRNFDKPTITEQYCCIGSQCMAWRWGEPKMIKPEFPLKVVDGGYGRKTTAVNDPVRVERGYCGLASTP